METQINPTKSAHSPTSNPSGNTEPHRDDDSLLSKVEIPNIHGASAQSPLISNHQLAELANLHNTQTQLMNSQHLSAQPDHHHLSHLHNQSQLISSQHLDSNDEEEEDEDDFNSSVLSTSSSLGTKFLTEAEPKEDKKISEGGEKEKKGGRRKINIEFIENKSRRHVTFSKRKAGLIKKAYELSTLTGTQVLLLVASETGNVYTFATPKLQPLITKPEGKTLIQQCLNPPEVADVAPPSQSNAPTSASSSSQRMLSTQEPNIYNTNNTININDKKLSALANQQYTIRGSDFQSRSPYDERYGKEASKGMPSGLEQLGMSGYGTVSNMGNPMSSSNPYSTNTGGNTPMLSNNSIPMYSYPINIGGFVPPSGPSRGFPDYQSYAHPAYTTGHQGGPNQGYNGLSQLPQSYSTYLSAFPPSSQYNQDPSNSSKDPLV